MPVATAKPMTAGDCLGRLKKNRGPGEGYVATIVGLGGVVSYSTNRLDPVSIVQSRGKMTRLQTKVVV